MLQKIFDQLLNTQTKELQIHHQNLFSTIKSHCHDIDEKFNQYTTADTISSQQEQIINNIIFLINNLYSIIIKNKESLALCSIFYPFLLTLKLNSMN